MKKIILQFWIVFLFISLTHYNVFAQLSIKNYAAITDPVINIIKALGGSTSNVFNLKTNISQDSIHVIGTFTNPSGIGFGSAFKNGIVFGSGNINTLLGPDTVFSNKNYKLPGSKDLDKYTTAPTIDAVIIEFDFIPYNDTISFLIYLVLKNIQNL